MREAVRLRRLIGDDGRDLVLMILGRSEDCDVTSSSSSATAAAASVTQNKTVASFKRFNAKTIMIFYRATHCMQKYA